MYRPGTILSHFQRTQHVAPGKKKHTQSSGCHTERSLEHGCGRLCGSSVCSWQWRGELTKDVDRDERVNGPNRVKDRLPLGGLASRGHVSSQYAKKYQRRSPVSHKDQSASSLRKKVHRDGQSRLHTLTRSREPRQWLRRTMAV
jgi:hypothetical protein